MPIEKPTNYVEQGKITGTTVAIVNAIKQKLGTQTPIEVAPFSRAYNKILNTPRSVLFTVAQTPQRTRDGLIFLGPVATHMHAVLTRADHKPQSREEILKAQIVIAGLRLDMRSELLKAQGFNVVEVSEHAHGLNMLMNGRVDYWLSSDMETAALNFDLYSEDAELQVAWVIKQDPSYIAFSPGTDQKLIRQWQTAFDELGNSDFFSQQVLFWQSKLNIPIEHTKQKGFHLSAPAGLDTGAR